MTGAFELRTAPLGGGTVMLEASAGTGKTYTLVGLLLRLLLERRIERIDQALVVTFTVAATEELKNRLRAALLRTLRATRTPDEDPFFAGLAARDDAAPLLRAALDDFDRVSIATIHGFCKRLLDEAAFESREPFELEFVADPVPHLHAAAADSLRAHYTQEISVPGALLHVAGLDPRELVRLYTLWQRYPDVRLDPAEPDPEANYPAVVAAVERAAAALDDGACALIAGIDWYANKAPFLVMSRYSTARLRERLAQHPLLGLAELREFGEGRLAKTAKQTARARLRHPFFAACSEVERAVDTAVEHLRTALLQQMHARLWAHKRREHVMDFQDLLLRTHAALHDPERRSTVLDAVRARYEVALIDEFQDTDRLQYEIFATCFQGRPLYLVGDPKQSIYGFRGADLRAYAAAHGDAAERYTLGRNFRSNALLVAAVQRACGKPGAFVDPLIALPHVDAHAAPGALALGGDDAAPLHWRWVQAGARRADVEELVAADVTAEISRLLRAGLRCGDAPLAARDIAVLCRTNKQAVLVQERLRRAGIVSAIGKAGDVFDTEELVELERVMAAVLQPRNLQACRAAMSTRIYGLDAAGLDALDRTEAAFDAAIADFDRWRRTWMRHGFFAMKEQLLEDRAVEASLLPQRGGERRLTNLQQLCELLHRAEHDNALSPEGLAEWLQHERLHREEIDFELRELRLESDGDAVQILTVHGSKGLEYEVVFCPFLWHAPEHKGAAIVPERDGRRLVHDLRKEHPRHDAADLERLAEDVRLCYVALTRARRRCYLHAGLVGRTAHKSALAWLLAPLPVAERRDGPGRSEGHWFVAWGDRIKDSPQVLADAIDALVAEDPTAMVRTDVPAEPTPEPAPAPAPERLAPPRRPVREPLARGLYSFSSLIAEVGPEPVARDTGDPDAMADDAVAPTGIFAFARGPHAGSCLHQVLERHDWDPAGDDALTTLARDTLTACGLADRAAHRADLDPVVVVVQNVRDLERALVHPEGPSYGALCRGRRVPEWQFTLPARDADTRALAELFADLGGPAAGRYAARLAQLPPRTLRGFLTGFVDLVAEHDGRFWIVDWKSNHLGDAAACYDAEAIATAMHDHDYVLQYHLYVLALHRMLGRRIPGYDYDRHFGGVGYAFLRGAVPGAANGMFFDRPPTALVAAMDAWAAGARTGGRR